MVISLSRIRKKITCKFVLPLLPQCYYRGIFLAVEKNEQVKVFYCFYHHHSCVHPLKQSNFYYLL